MQDFKVRQKSAGSFTIATLMKGAFGEMDKNNNKVTDKNKHVLLSNDLLRALF